MQNFRSLADMKNITQNSSRSQKQRVLMAYKGAVYDLTQFANMHPGGREALLQYKGQDVENILFNPAIHRHSFNALKTMEPYRIGIVKMNTLPVTNTSTTPQKSTTPPTNNNRSQKTPPQKSPAPTTNNNRPSNTSPNNKQTQLKNQTLQKQTNQSSTQSRTSPRSASQSQSEILKQPTPFKSPSQTHTAQKSNTLQLRDEFVKQTSSASHKAPMKSSTAQFLGIPGPREVLAQQKLKMQRMVEEERQKYLKAQQEQAQRKTQSEILSPPDQPVNRPKSTNSFYEQWKKQNEQIPQSSSSISNPPESPQREYMQEITERDSQENSVSSPQFGHREKPIIKGSQSLDEITRTERPKAVNSYYEQWKQQQQNQSNRIITEQDEEQQGTRKRASSLFSCRSMYFEESPSIYVPVLEAKFLSLLKR